MTAALLVGPGVVLVAIALLYATTLLDRLVVTSRHGPEPLATVLAHAPPVAGGPVGPLGMPTHRGAGPADRLTRFAPQRKKEAKWASS